MCSEELIIEDIPSPMSITGDAVGVPKTEDTPFFWYIGLVATNKEKRLRDELKKLSYQVFLPSQNETREWSQGRKRTIERLIIPGYIFIRCTEEQRLKIFSDPDILPRIKPYLSRWMVDKASTVSQYGRHNIAIVPDHEMQQFIEMVDKANKPITFDSSRFRKGDKIRITNGNLEGCTGELEVLPNHAAKLVVRIKNLGAAKVEIDAKDIEILTDNDNNN